MEPLVHVVTLAVEDLGRALAFYRDGLGWKVAKERPAYAYFHREGGPWISLCERKLLRDELGDAPDAVSVISQNVARREDVDATLAAAVGAGAKLARRASDRVWGGRSGSFQDPDGHFWEITWNPRAVFDDDGSIASFG
jgi:catechol 2,3-dioxygenase-like lactoylglutathione lyase family enzyme